MLTTRDKKILRWLEIYHAATLKQISVIFFDGCYDSCRRRLKQLVEAGHLKTYNISYSKEKAFYFDKKLSEHDLIRYNLIKRLIELKCKIKKVETSVSLLNGLVKPDMYLEFVYNNKLYFVLVEVDYTHYTPNSKMQLYEKVFKDGELRGKCHGTFPIVILSRASKNDLRYNSKNFKVVYTDYNFNDIENFLFV